MTFIAMAFSALLAELVAFTVVQQADGLLAALGMHAMVTACLLLWVAAGPRERARQPAALFTVLVAPTGPFGAGIGLLAGLVCAGRTAQALTPADWIDTLLAAPQQGEVERIRDRLAMGKDHVDNIAVEPFQDILRGGTVLQKQMVIAKISRHFRPQFSRLLLEAVGDGNAAVRVQAASALGKLEHDFTRQYMRVEKSLRDTPLHDDGWLPLARLSDDYVQAGLLDAESRRALAAQAVAIYEAHLDHRENADIRIRLGALHLHLGQPEKARQSLTPALESPEVSPAAVLGYLEALFRLKKIRQVRQLARRYADMLKKLDESVLPPETDAALQVWSAAALPAPGGRRTYAG